MGYRILIVDDENDILSMLKDFFEINGYFVLTADNGYDAIKQAQKQPDIILLDINMPKMNGFDVCEKIRNFVLCPILFVTARTEDIDKVLGFKIGADDYIVKPFSINELGARVEAHLRREFRSSRKTKIMFDGNFVIDYISREVFYKKNILEFTKIEFDIIELLSTNHGQVFSKERIYDNVWSWDSEGDSSVVVEHIRRIRSKILNSGSDDCIKTVWGVGYKWVG